MLKEYEVVLERFSVFAHSDDEADDKIEDYLRTRACDLQVETVDCLGKAEEEYEKDE